MINIVTSLPGRKISEEKKKKVTDVSPQVNLQDASSWVSEEMAGNLHHQKELNNMLGNTEILLACELPNNLIKRAPRIKWIQTTHVGVEKFLKDKDLIESPLTLTNASGIQAEAISEYVILLMLAFDKHLMVFAELKKQKNWKRITMVGLASQTIGILGLGNIGKAVAKRARALGMHVIAYDRPRKLMRAQNVDKLVSGDDIKQIFKESDFVVSCLPLSPKTIGIIGEKELRMMQPTAHLINISRGKVVKEDVLIRALKEKWIAGAGLDVFMTEPLPADSPLWDLPNVIYSPHCCGRLDDKDDRVMDLFTTNLKRYVNGRRLLNRVDKKAGF